MISPLFLKSGICGKIIISQVTSNVVGHLACSDPVVVALWEEYGPKDLDVMRGELVWGVSQGGKLVGHVALK